MKIIILINLLLAAALLPLPAAADPFCFEEAGAAVALPARLLESIAVIESGLNAAAVNHNRNGSSDFGLMQINSSWLAPARLDRERLLTDACYNTKAGARILRDCIDRHGYTWEAVGCYNASSRDKRKNYAWKVYRQLTSAAKEERLQPAEPLTAGTPARVERTSTMTVSFEERTDAAEPRQEGQKR